MNYYGVSQSCHGHEYRWIFDEQTLINNGVDFSTFEDGEYVDILYPIGGSNSSATCFQKLADDEEIESFLKGEADGPDVSDPMLVDIAEYLLTVDTDYDSCTQEFLDKFNLKKEDLSQYDDYYHHRSESERMIAEIATDKDLIDNEIDFDDPFYGRSREMRYSELCDLYDQFVAAKESGEERG